MKNVTQCGFYHRIPFKFSFLTNTKIGSSLKFKFGLRILLFCCSILLSFDLTILLQFVFNSTNNSKVCQVILKGHHHKVIFFEIF